nr:NYN domain-containing protein [Actinomycetota bacterium]
MPEDLAIFIDWENIYISTVTEYKSKPNVSAILEKSREYGRIVSATAYADWTEGDFRQAPPTLYSNGISPRYISARYFPGGKASKRRTNSIDVMLAVECSDFLHNHPQVDTYVLVTGDGDFIPLVSLLRSQGKTVVVIGVSEATSYHLIESADHFISYASLIEEDRVARTPDKEPKKAAADPYQELVRAVETLKKGGRPRVLGQVKQQMIVQLGSFDERNAGFKKFKDFVVEAERRNLVNTVDQDLELQVYLPDEQV